MPPQFAMGRPPPQRLSERVRKRSKHIPYQHARGPPFLLSPNQTTDFVLTWTLARFPQKSYQAITELHKLLAPPTPTHPKFYVWTPEQRKKLSGIVLQTIKLRWIFRRFYLQYITQKIKCRNKLSDQGEGALDPITFEPISWPCWITDLRQRARYDFECKSLAKVWSSNLLQHDGLFLEPRFPINPLTNLPVNLLTLHTAFKRMKRYGALDWVLSSFESCHYDLNKWKQKFAGPLYIESIQKVFADKESYDRLDMLLDFAELQYDTNGMDFPKAMFKWIFKSPLVEEYARLWVKECKAFYIKKYSLVDKDDVEDLEIATSVECAYLLEIPTIVKVMYEKEVGKRNERNRLIITTGTFRIIRYPAGND